MNILTIPLRIMRRKWVKTSLLLLVFALGVTSIVSLNYVSSVIGESLEKKLTAYGANILVMPKREKLTVSYGGFALGDMVLGQADLRETEVDRLVHSIKLNERISVVAPKLVSMARIDEAAVGVIGVRWDKERALKGYWAVDGQWPSTPGEILAGARVAERLGLRPGTTMPLGDGEVTVAGVLLPTGSDDDSVLFADMDYAQQQFGKPGHVSFVEVAALCSGCPIDDIVAQLRQVLPGAEIHALQSIVKQRMYSVNFVKQLVLTVSLIILLIACCMVGVTMLSSVNERIREIGLMRSLGFSRGGIFSIFCFEAAFIGVLAGAFGHVAGYFLSRQVLHSLDMAGGAMPGFEPAHLAVTCLLFVTLSVLSALFPAWKAASVQPSRALISL